MNDRNLNRLVAENITHVRSRMTADSLDAYPNYVGDIAAAWTIVEKMRTDGWSMWIGPHFESGWAVEIKPLTQNSHEFVRADTAPRAIVLAALKAKGIDV